MLDFLHFLITITIVSFSFVVAPSEAFTLGTLLPEITPTKVDEVSQVVSKTLNKDSSEETRKIEVQNLSVNFNSTTYESNQFVYGELSIPTLATILDAVGVHENERFLDIGSGDGALVFAAALFYGDIHKSRGLEIVPELFERSQHYCNQFLDIKDRVELYCGDIYECDTKIQSLLHDSSLVICFATTWSAHNHRRELPQLSKVLGIHLKPGTRIVIVDGNLDEKDNLQWHGDLKIHCTDTAPYSIASLYEKVT